MTDAKSTNEIFLVPLTLPGTAPHLLAAATVAAAAAGPVRIDVLGVRVPPETMVIPGDEAISAVHLTALADQEAARVAKLKRAFDAWAPGVGPHVSTSWIEADGITIDTVAGRAQNADLVIVERPGRPADPGQKQIIDAAIFESHRPVLVVPPGTAAIAFGKKIAVAWKDDGRAVNALIPALRYFGGAEFTVLAGYRQSDTPPALPSALTDRGVKAALNPIPIGADIFGQVLLNKASEVGADLLVMGAYAHSPLREMLLGGVTRYVLGHAEIPVLLRH